MLGLTTIFHFGIQQKNLIFLSFNPSSQNKSTYNDKNAPWYISNILHKDLPTQTFHELIFCYFQKFNSNAQNYFNLLISNHHNFTNPKNLCRSKRKGTGDLL